MDVILDSPNTLLTNLPALLGFRPEHSLIITVIQAGHLRSVMRVDLTPNPTDAVGRIADAAARQHADGAILVIVDNCDNHDHRPLIEVLDAALTVRGVTVVASYIVDTITAGGRWRCLDGCGSAGILTDPATALSTTVAVTAGRRIHASRQELEAVIAHDHHKAAAMTRLLEAVAASGTTPRLTVAAAIAAARRFTTGATVTDDALAIVGAGLVDKRVRDMLLGLALTADSNGAQMLWTALARVLPQPWRKEALTLLAFFAYACGDGPLAGIALDVVLDTDASHRLAQLLDHALQSAMRPEAIRELAEVGYRVADEIGVIMPARSEETT